MLFAPLFSGHKLSLEDSCMQTGCLKPLSYLTTSFGSALPVFQAYDKLFKHLLDFIALCLINITTLFIYLIQYITSICNAVIFRWGGWWLMVLLSKLLKRQPGVVLYEYKMPCEHLAIWHVQIRNGIQLVVFYPCENSHLLLEWPFPGGCYLKS